MIEKQKFLAQESARKILIEANIKSAPVDVEKIISRLEIEYIETDQMEDDLSGFIKRLGKNNKPVIVVNKGHGEQRRRFTAAHELGHYILHSMDDVFVDTANEKVLYRKRDSSLSADPKEVEANNFAAELLMPREMLAKDIGGGLPSEETSLNQLINKLADKYKVSTQAMTIRLGSFLY